MFLKGRDLLSLNDLIDSELSELIAFARELKSRFHAGEPMDFLMGAQIFSMDPEGLLGSWNPIAIGMTQLGGVCTDLGDGGLREELGETWLDRGRLLDLSGHGLAVTGRSVKWGHPFMEELAAGLNSPVINLMSDLAAPLQAIASSMAVQERLGEKMGEARAAIVWAPPGRATKPMSRPLSLAEILLRQGVAVRMACPLAFHPGAELADYLDAFLPGIFEIGEDPGEAIDGADVVFSMNWAPDLRQHSLEELAAIGSEHQGWRMEAEALEFAAPESLLGGGLPQNRDFEIQGELLDGERSIHLEESANMLHVAKAVLALILDPSIHGNVQENHDSTIQ